MSKEEVAKTEVMRHVPELTRLIRLLDVELRDRINTLYTSALGNAEEIDGRLRQEIEEKFDRVVEKLEEVTVAAGARVSGNGSGQLRRMLEVALDRAVDALRALDAAAFRHRNPAHRFERGKGELVVAAVIVAECAVADLVPLVALIDEDLNEKLLREPENARAPLLSSAATGS